MKSSSKVNNVLPTQLLTEMCFHRLNKRCLPKHIWSEDTNCYFKSVSYLTKFVTWSVDENSKKCTIMYTLSALRGAPAALSIQKQILC
ncbi:hypothetical protein QTP88_012537 [Uroleucon formosanum]